MFSLIFSSKFLLFTSQLSSRSRGYVEVGQVGHMLLTNIYQSLMQHQTIAVCGHTISPLQSNNVFWIAGYVYCVIACLSLYLGSCTSCICYRSVGRQCVTASSQFYTGIAILDLLTYSNYQELLVRMWLQQVIALLYGGILYAVLLQAWACILAVMFSESSTKFNIVKFYHLNIFEQL